MKHLLLMSVASQCTLAYGQKKWMTDKEFNHPKVAFYVNGTFVKSLIGFDLKARPGDSLTKENLEKPLVINDIEYKGKATFKREKEPDFVTLDDIRRSYCPEVEEPVIYMINEYFITDDVASYKLDKDYIDKCEVLRGTDFEIFKENPAFSIIRVFTKTDDKTVRLR